MRCAPWATLCSWWHGAVQSVVCHQDSTSKPLVVLLSVTACPITCFEGIESLINMTWRQDGRTFVVECETLERAPTPLFGILVRCSAHGCFFARLWYLYTEGSLTKRTSWKPFLVASVQVLELRTFMKWKLTTHCSGQRMPAQNMLFQMGPPSVYPGRHWCHSCDKFPLWFCIL